MSSGFGLPIGIYPPVPSSSFESPNTHRFSLGFPLDQSILCFRLFHWGQRLGGLPWQPEATSLVLTQALSSSITGTLSLTETTLSWAFLGGRPHPLFLPAIFAMRTWDTRTVEGDG